MLRSGGGGGQGGARIVEVDTTSHGDVGRAVLVGSVPARAVMAARSKSLLGLVRFLSILLGVRLQGLQGRREAARGRQHGVLSHERPDEANYFTCGCRVWHACKRRPTVSARGRVGPGPRPQLAEPRQTRRLMRNFFRSNSNNC